MSELRFDSLFNRPVALCTEGTCSANRPPRGAGGPRSPWRLPKGPSMPVPVASLICPSQAGRRPSGRSYHTRRARGLAGSSAWRWHRRCHESAEGPLYHEPGQPSRHAPKTRTVGVRLGPQSSALQCAPEGQLGALEYPPDARLLLPVTIQHATGSANERSCGDSPYSLSPSPSRKIRCEQAYGD